MSAKILARDTLVAIAVVAVVFSVFLLAVNHFQKTTRMMLAASQMYTISDGLNAYHQNYAALPPPDQWQQLLVDGSYMNPAFVDSPAGDEVDHDYFMVPATRRNPDRNSNRILIYENPKIHRDRVLVAFHNGRVEYVPREEFEAMLEDITLPDGTDFEPLHGP